MTRWQKLLVAATALAAGGYAYWRLAVPEHRVAITSELVMLGDLDGDRHWTARDLEDLGAYVDDPFAVSDAVVWRLDLNQNGLIDEEDLGILRALVAAKGDPYVAEAARARGSPFPRPRELYRYASTAEYRPRPLWALPYPRAQDSVLPWLAGFQPSTGASPYARALDLAIHAEAVRFDQAYRRREPGLLPIERDYAARKLARVETLFREGRHYELLLALIDLVEDAETLAAPRQPDIVLELLTFRDHMRGVLASPAYAEFAAGRQDWRAVLRVVSRHLKTDLNLDYDFETLGRPRNLGHLENYLQRAEWQYYKSSARERDFVALVAYAQHDLRYLRAVSRTTRTHQDPSVENHNLPMVLLFREALRIEGGDKKKAVGLLDDAIRIPYAWIKFDPPRGAPRLAGARQLPPARQQGGRRRQESPLERLRGHLPLQVAARGARSRSQAGDAGSPRRQLLCRGDARVLPRHDRQRERHVPRDDRRARPTRAREGYGGRRWPSRSPGNSVVAWYTWYTRRPHPMQPFSSVFASPGRATPKLNAPGREPL